MRSQCQCVNESDYKTWEEYRKGCLGTFVGGHHDDGKLSAFQHGMNTVFNLLEGEFPQPEVIFKTSGRSNNMFGLFNRRYDYFEYDELLAVSESRSKLKKHYASLGLDVLGDKDPLLDEEKHRECSRLEKDHYVIVPIKHILP